MSLTDAQQRLLEAQQKVLSSRQAFNQATQHVNLLEREQKRVQITQRELETLQDDHHTYKGVGRMFVLTPVVQLREGLNTRETNCQEELPKALERRTASEKTMTECEEQFREHFKAFKSLQEAQKA
eukprot:NODE_6683_length_509_cov_28.335079_g6517_i0.p1 GENE.NODE_6683_length_509_cov_28.335079_g6517_i0~~NODE_6683_length_509_cov_28.335079_g6517_i0.p1  ORF type:complete len:126 (+),score=29.92 NODE_6683_length_509_cov_28.335079_g6517_i0:63-440(+)